jgi:hypothetical protein
MSYSMANTISFSPEIGSPWNNMVLTSDSPAPFIPSITYNQQNPYFPLLQTPLNYSEFKPLVAVPLAPDLNLDLDVRVHDQMTKYFYYKTLDKWLYNEMLDVLSYLKIDGKGVSTIDSMKNRDSNVKETQETVEKKIKYIEDNVFSQKSMRKMLTKYVEDTGTHWYELTKNKPEIKSLIKKFLKSKFEHIVDGKLH